MKMTARQAKREALKKQKARQQIYLYGGIGVAVIAVVVVIVLLVSNGAASSGGLLGDEVPNPSRDHVPTTGLPGPYATNPPAGGAHYDTPFSAKFFLESDLAALPAHPEGYLVHSLEHGYVIFWYNCQAPNTDCATLKQTIQKVMDTTGGTKLIAFPWPTMDVPLAMTSWGRILKFPTIDTALMEKFVIKNRYQSPEPDGE
jgi:hypothetical protein